MLEGSSAHSVTNGVQNIARVCVENFKHCLKTIKHSSNIPSYRKTFEKCPRTIVEKCLLCNLLGHIFGFC